MLTKKDYEQAHKEFPLSAIYRNKPEECYHDYSFVIFCNNKTDIVRCRKCGSEIERKCNFDY